MGLIGVRADIEWACIVQRHFALRKIIFIFAHVIVLTN